MVDGVTLGGTEATPVDHTGALYCLLRPRDVKHLTAVTRLHEKVRLSLI